MDDLFSRNLAFLAAHAATATYEAVVNARSANRDQWRLTMMHDRAGNPQLRPYLGNDLGAPLHSSRDPEGEATRQVDRWVEKNPVNPGRILVVFGIAGAYHLKELAARLGDSNGLLVIDANPSVVADALQLVDLTPLAAAGLKRITFIVGSDAERLFTEFYTALAAWPRLDYSFFIHTGTQRAFGSLYDPLAARFAERVRVDMIQRSTISNLTRGWLENSIRNLPLLMDSAPIRSLSKQFAGIPAAVVAAGPTLETCLPLLRQLNDRVVIIAVGTAYRPLRAAGIDPHIVVLVDGSPLLKRQFEKVDTDKGWLMTPPQIHPEVVRSFQGRLVLWQTGALPEFKDWCAQNLEVPADCLGAGGTVTYSAIDAARYMGCTPILTFGLDLAYQDDGRSHARKTMYDDTEIRKVKMVTVPGNLRPTVQTTSQFAAYIELLASFAASIVEQNDCELINVNPDGARIPNMRHRRPEDVDPTTFPQLHSQTPEARIAELCQGGDRMSQATLLRVLDETRSDLNIMGEKAREAAVLCRKLAKGGGFEHPKAESRLVKLKKAEKRLGEKSPGGLLLSAAVRASSIDTVAFCAAIDGNDETGFVRVHEKCRDYYGELETVLYWLRQELGAIRPAVEDACAKPHEQGHSSW